MGGSARRKKPLEHTSRPLLLEQSGALPLPPHERGVPLSRLSPTRRLAGEQVLLPFGALPLVAQNALFPRASSLFTQNAVKATLRAPLRSGLDWFEFSPERRNHSGTLIILRAFSSEIEMARHERTRINSKRRIPALSFGCSRMMQSHEGG